MKLFSSILIVIFSSYINGMGIHPFSLESKSSIQKFYESKSINDLYGCTFIFIAQFLLGKYQGGERGLNKTLNDYQVSDDDLIRYTIEISGKESESEKIDVIQLLAKELLEGKWAGNVNNY